MLPLSYRLPTPLVSSVLRHGKRVHGLGMTIVYLVSKNPSVQVSTKNTDTRTPGHADTPPPRFAFVAGVKVSKKAVERNRVKRLLRESVQHLLPALKPGQDVVIVAKKELVGLTQQQVESEIKKLIRDKPE